MRNKTTDFEILGRKSIYSGRIFALNRVEARLPDGQVRQFDVIQHNGAVALLVLDDEENLWLVRQYRIATGKSLLEIPAGSLEPGETPAECAAREIREETGMASRSITHLASFYLAPGYSSEYLHIFLARDLYPSPLAGDADEFLDIQKVPAREALAMAQRGEFADGKTYAALLLLQPYLNR
ncbi:MAG TPA: NUDIX hydrolase [Anaerolineaceae bacterium]